MNQEEIKLNKIHEYVDNIKKFAYKNIYNLENLVLNKNPYTSDFIKNYLFDINHTNPSIFFIIKKTIYFYTKSFIRFFIYLISFIIFKIKYKKKADLTNDIIIIDTFFLMDKIINEQQFNEKYFSGLYEVLDKYNIQYVFLPRLYTTNNNPFKTIKLMDILNKDKNNFLFEYELLSILDLFKIIKFILMYPFKIYKLFQNTNNNLDSLFNYEIINTLPNTSFIAYIRYLIGKKLVEKLTTSSKIISWQEFQNLEKTFNKAVKESKQNIQIYGCQFSIQYQNYISMHISDIDYELGVTPHMTLLNGKYNYALSTKQPSRKGVSLRYKKIFEIDNNEGSGKDIVVLLTYEANESNRLLKLINYIDEEVKVKIHPATSQKQFESNIHKNWKFVTSDVYALFKNTRILFVASMSGTALEAVASGVSVIIIGSMDNITANPLIEYGKGKIWDIAFSEDDVKLLYNHLINYRKNNKEEIKNISKWYKENFFIVPSEENIIKAFEVKKKELEN